MPLIARLVLGRHWRTASEAQRRDYLELFRGYCLDGLVKRLGGMTGHERVVVTGSVPAKDQDSMVSTEIEAEPRRPPTRVGLRVRRKQEGLKIIDVVAEGVSPAGLS